MVKVIHNRPKGMHAPFSHYSHSVVVEGPHKTIYCAGQVAGDETGKILDPHDFEAQGELVITNLKRVLSEVGRDIEQRCQIGELHLQSPRRFEGESARQETLSRKSTGQHNMRPTRLGASRLSARDRRDRRRVSKARRPSKLSSSNGNTVYKISAVNGAR